MAPSSPTPFQYPKGPKNIVGSCYLIRHGDKYMLWDTGLATPSSPNPYDSPGQTIRLKRSLVDQLRQIGVRPEQIEIIGISHWHFDHTGQAASFPAAKLVIGKGDFDALKGTVKPGGGDPEHLKHWLSGGGTVVEATADVDVFHDGRVVMLNLPGHTPGHNALLSSSPAGTCS
jgi:glyoxylase-like metal-dependent hydrolase (beta-lactamase superfamily II)